MIPLMKPLLPNMATAQVFFRESIDASQFTNFGPNFWAVCNQLNKMFSRYMLPVSNGTSAIEIACKTIFSPGDRIVIPDFTHIGTYSGAKAFTNDVILSKVDTETWTLSLQELEKHVNDFDAMIVVSPFGYPVDVEKYDAFAEFHHKKIVYDFAGAWGEFPDTKWPVTYSLHATKCFTTGEGGIISFPHKFMFDDARRVSGFDIQENGHICTNRGVNSKMDEFRCSLLRSHLATYGEIYVRLTRRKMIHEFYCSEIQGDTARDNIGSPSLSTFKGLGGIDLTKLPFVSKYYYPLLSNEDKFYFDIPKFSKSDGDFETCLALPTDLTYHEQVTVIEALQKEIRC